MSQKKSAKEIPATAEKQQRVLIFIEFYRDSTGQLYWCGGGNRLSFLELIGEVDGADGSWQSMGSYSLIFNGEPRIMFGVVLNIPADCGLMNKLKGVL